MNQEKIQGFQAYEIHFNGEILHFQNFNRKIHNKIFHVTMALLDFKSLTFF